MLRCPRSHSQNSPRRAGVALEMLIVLPVFLTLILGFVELSMVVVIEERLASASAQGARVAAQGGTAYDVQQAVQNAIGPGVLSNNLRPLQITPADPTTAYSGMPVSVTVQVYADKVVPNLLGFVGISLSNQTLVGQTTLRKE